MGLGGTVVYAQDDTGGGYLNYQEPQPNTGLAGGLSGFLYGFSLLITFAIIIGLAYFTSRWLGGKMGSSVAVGADRIISTLPLGPNRSVVVAEIAGKVLILGVTDHAVNLLQEITGEDERQKVLARQPVGNPDNFEQIFKKQLTSLQTISQKIPALFDFRRREDPGNNGGKR